MLDNLRVNPIINPIRGANMSNNKNVEQLKDKAADLGTDIKHQVKEAQLSGEKTLDDLKHSAKEVKLEAEKKLDDLKQDVRDAKDVHNQDSSQTETGSTTEQAKDKFTGVKNNAQEKFEHLKTEASHKLDEAKVKANELKHDASLKFDELKVQATEKFDELKKKANETLSKFKKDDQAQTDNQSVQESTSDNATNDDKKV